MSAIREVWQNPYVRVIVYALVVYLLYGIASRLSGLITVAALAYLFAYLFNPLVELSRRRGIPRGVGIGLVFVLVVLFLILASVLLGTIVQQLLEFTRRLPELVQTLQASLRSLIASLEQFRSTPQVGEIIDRGTAAVQEALSSIAGRLVTLLQGSGLNILTGAVGIVGNVLQFFLVFIIGGYMLASFPQIGRTLTELLPRRVQPLALDLAKDVNQAVGGYIRGQLVIALAVGTMVGIGLAILGIPLALTLGFLSAIFNVVPYLGVIISIVPALLLAAQFGLLKVLLVVLVFAVANQVESTVLSPMILSRSTDLHPVTVVLAILAGAALFGILGALLAVPVAAFLKLLVRKYWLNSPLHEAPA